MPGPEPESIENNDELNPFGESEEDLHHLDDKAAYDAVVVSTDWTAETLLAQISRGKVELDPAFQRRDAWDRIKKSRFVESLVVGLPVPQIVLAERQGRRGEYLVIDGKQRLLALSQYASQEFRLHGLELRDDLNRRLLEELPESDRQALLTQTVRTVVVRNWKIEDFLYLVFMRLNTGNVPLSPQELRQALHPGPFVSFVNEYTSDDAQFHRLFGRKVPDFRMRDVELLVRFFAFTRFLPDYTGDLKRLLDTTCARLNTEWVEEQDQIKSEAKQCSEAIWATYEIFEGDAFHRWNGESYENRFNRAVYDVMVYYARDPAVRQGMLAKKSDVRAAFKSVCLDDDFDEAITRTTKSLDSVFNRISIWGDALGEVVGLEPVVPIRTVDGRIAFP